MELADLYDSLHVRSGVHRHIFGLSRRKVVRILTSDCMGHEHSHAPSNFGTAFAIGVTLNLAFVILEVIYGRLSNSLALVARRA